MKNTANKKAPELLIKISLSFLAFLVTLALVEGMARLLVPAPGNAQFIPDAEVGYRHAPDQRLWVSDETGEFRALFQTNQFGDPDRERTLEKPEGVFRVAVVGDSMVEAAQVSLEERFTYLLERDLTAWVEQEPVPIHKVEVMNFGTAGYSTAQEWLNYRAHIRSFQPDLVLLVFLPGNDIKNNSYELEVVQSCRAEIAPFFQLAGGQELVLMNENFYEKAQARYQKEEQTLIEVLKETVWKDIRLVSLASQAYAALRSTERVSQVDEDACQTETTLQLYDPEVQRSSTDWQEAWQITSAIINQFAQDAASDQAAFHLVTVTGPWEVQPETRDLVLPAAEQAQYDWELAHRMTAEMAETLAIPDLQVLPAMQRAVQDEGIAVHYKYNGHYTPEGHQVLAQALFPLLQQYLLK